MAVMVGRTAFVFGKPEHAVKVLQIDDASILQELYEKCADYNYLMEGQPPSPTAALDEFTAIPEGRSLHDKYMLGIFAPRGRLIGLLEGMRNYPEARSLWVGLIMLDPTYRRQGLLVPLLAEFERYLAGQGIDYVMGSVVQANDKVLRLWRQMGFEVVRRVEREAENPRLRSWSTIKRKVGDRSS